METSQILGAPKADSSGGGKIKRAKSARVMESLQGGRLGE